MNKIELLAPAKNADTAIAAINCGADAVYIGPPCFGARQAAGNSIEDIKRVTEYAHLYYAKVYATFNTILRDDELEQARLLIGQLHGIGIDGIIIQDVGLLELDLPGVPIIASTQMNVDSVEKAKFFESIGFRRIILPREMSLDEIAEIRNGCNVELESFVHGAICVGRSGQCYMSYAIGGRSGNRGVCAQPCRKKYRLEDESGKVICEDAYLLSIKDMNRSEYLGQMIDAGITTFKIEGRLKSVPYVANITAYYRKLIDEIIAKKNVTQVEFVKASSGSIEFGFEPEPERSFNRGFTAYNITGRQEKMGTPDTPKSMGQYIGTVSRLNVNCFEIDGEIELNNGDGICFFDRGGKLAGTVINSIEDNENFPKDMDGLYLGCEVYRNNDHDFNKLLEKVSAKRKIAIEMELAEFENGLTLKAIDEDGVCAEVKLICEKEAARNTETAKENLQKNLTKLGNTIFKCDKLTISLEQMYFLQAAMINELRRQLVDNLMKLRDSQRPASAGTIVNNDQPYPQTSLDFTANVLNKKAEQFYKTHGVKTITPAAEAGTDTAGKTIMHTRYCIRKQLNICEKPNAEDLYLIDKNKNRFRITFDCNRCGMRIAIS